MGVFRSVSDEVLTYAMLIIGVAVRSQWIEASKSRMLACTLVIGWRTLWPSSNMTMRNTPFHFDTKTGSQSAYPSLDFISARLFFFDFVLVFGSATALRLTSLVLCTQSMPTVRAECESYGVRITTLEDLGSVGSKPYFRSAGQLSSFPGASHIAVEETQLCRYFASDGLSSFEMIRVRSGNSS